MVSLAVMNNPPFSTNACKCSRPTQLQRRDAYRPSHRVWDRCRVAPPKFGVSAVVFQGSGLPYIGAPLITACGIAASTGREDDHVVLLARKVEDRRSSAC